MEIDQKKLETAITYISRMADGNNPVNNRPMPEHEVLNNPNVIRCMFFIKEILEQVQRNGGVSGSRRNGSRKIPYPFEITDQFQFTEDKTITHVLRQLQKPIEGTDIKKIGPTVITGWLKNEGYLAETRKANGEKETLPTPKGEELGLYTLEREYNGRAYQAVLYNRKAQEFVAAHLRDAVEWKNNTNTTGNDEFEGRMNGTEGQRAGYENLAGRIIGISQTMPAADDDNPF